MAYLSSQERGWIIHCYLAQAEAVVPDPVPYYALVWVFEGAHGNIAFYGVKEIGETRDGLVDGGWATAKDPTVNEELTAMYDKAFEGFTGAAHEPIALLSTQVVAGTNKRINESAGEHSAHAHRSGPVHKLLSKSSIFVHSNSISCS